MKSYKCLSGIICFSKCDYVYTILYIVIRKNVINERHHKCYEPLSQWGKLNVTESVTLPLSNTLGRKVGFRIDSGKCVIVMRSSHVSAQSVP